MLWLALYVLGAVVVLLIDRDESGVCYWACLLAWPLILASTVLVMATAASIYGMIDAAAWVRRKAARRAA